MGFGTWQMPDGETAADAVMHAIEAGYTHIDTAAVYHNEIGVGAGIRMFGSAKRKAVCDQQAVERCERL